MSAQTGDGLDDLWTQVREHHAALAADGTLQALRESQRATWLGSEIEWGLRRAFEQSPAVQARLAAVEAAVRDGTLLPSQAARELLDAFSEEMGSDA